MTSGSPTSPTGRAERRSSLGPPSCARREGFSRHATVALAARAREQLEPLCRYRLRPRWPWTDSPRAPLDHSPTSCLIRVEIAPPICSLDPLELIEELCVLIAPPRFHLLRFHGVLAPRPTPLRSRPSLPPRPGARWWTAAAGPG